MKQRLETLQSGDWFKVCNLVGKLIDCNVGFATVIYNNERTTIAPSAMVEKVKEPVVIKPKVVSPNNRKRWTPEEEIIIEKNVRDCDIPALMEMLPGRSAYSVEYKIWHLKLEHIAKQKYVDG